MPEIETSAIVEGTTPDDLVEVGTYSSIAEGSQHGLVILAMGHPYWLEPEGDSIRLLVEPAIAASARHQLTCFDRESVGWPPRPLEPVSPVHRAHFVTPLLWSLLLLASFHAQARRPGITAQGALDPAAMIQHGEWWRAFTALFLHADAGHVVSNAVSGIFAFAAVTSTLGILRGWLLVGFAAVGANLTLGLLTGAATYRSIGASTAVFAGLGVLTGQAVRTTWGPDRPARWRPALFPLVAGATLLALYGAGGVRVDLGAHVAGFTAGVILGLAFGLKRRDGRTP